MSDASAFHYVVTFINADVSKVGYKAAATAAAAAHNHDACDKIFTTASLEAVTASNWDSLQRFASEMIDQSTISTTVDFYANNSPPIIRL